MQLELGQRFEQRARLELRLEQRLEEPHSSIANPELTILANNMSTPNNPSELLNLNKDDEDLLFDVEHYLLQKWSFRHVWESLLDSPMIVHADAARQLNGYYDCALAVSSAGIPYGTIFKMAGSMPIFTVDYSHHKRAMTDVAPMSKEVLDCLREKRNVLLIDIDCCTGKTLRTINTYLKNEGIINTGAYLGLSRWKGLGIEGSLGRDNVDFNRFWSKSQSGLVECVSKTPYKNGILPNGFELYGPNQRVATHPKLAMQLAKWVAMNLR